MMLTESIPFGSFLLSEANGHRSRENVTIISGQKLVAGAVVGKITASSKFTEYDNGASDGSQAAAGILLGAVDASDGDMPGVLIARDAEVKKDTLTWKSGADDTAKNAGIADLAALGIIVRS